MTEKEADQATLRILNGVYKNIEIDLQCIQWSLSKIQKIQLDLTRKIEGE